MKQLFKRDFTMVVIGQIISLFGNAILRFALPLYLLRETDSSSLRRGNSLLIYPNGDFFSLWGSYCRQKKQTEYHGNA